MSNTTAATNTVGGKGYKTSEFWVLVLTTIFSWLNVSGALGDFQIPVEALSTIVELAVAYILGRMGLKVIPGALNALGDKVPKG